MTLYAAILRLSPTQDRAVLIKADTLTKALVKVDTMRGVLISIAPVVSNEAYLRAVEDVEPTAA